MESLYRKYRPLTFESVVGQRHIVSTLEHAITEGRLSHAYLFCGPRGTGKTTMARILAKALLCERAAAARAEGASGCMPDGSCEECQRIAEGTHPDVYELDAASRTGVDNVREEIINSVSFAPVRGAYKIYIIDEVHMLTTQAFNALLKTLEEPPEHVLFVLCTTDPQKIPETILSRCQRFDFHRIGNEDIVGRLAYICEQEGFDYDAEALEIVAKHARGGMRDALSTLEQLSVFGNGSVHASDARALLGEVSGTVLSEFSRAIAARDVATLFGLVRTQVDAGEDLMELTRDLVAHTRDIYMVSVAGARPELFDGTEDVEALAEEAGLFGTADRLARALTVLDDAALEMRTAADTRLVLEIALTRLARPESDLTLEALAERIDRLESRIASGVPAAPLDASGVAALAGVRGAVAKAPVANEVKASMPAGVPVPNEAKASMPAGVSVSAEASAAAGTSGSAGTSKPDKVSTPAGAAVSAAEQASAPAGAKTAGFAGKQMTSPAEGGASARSEASHAAGEAHCPSVSTPTEAAAAHVEERGTVPVAPVVPQDSRVMDPSVRAERREADVRSDQGVQAAHAARRGPARAGGPGAEHASGPEAVRPASAVGQAAPTAAAAPSRPSAAAVPAAPSRPSAAEIAASAAAPTPAVTDAGELQRKWSDVVKRVTAAQPSRGALLQSSRAQSDDGSALTVSFPPGSGFAITMLGRPDTQEIVLPQVCAVFGNRAVHYVMDGSAAVPKTSAPQPSAPAASVPEAPASAARPEATAPAAPQAAEAPAAPQAAAESSAPATYPSPAASASPDASEPVAKKPSAMPAAQEPASGLSPDSAPWAPAPAEFGPAPEPASSVSERKLDPVPSEPAQAPAPALTKPAQAPASEAPAWDDDQVPYDDAAAMAYDDDLPPFDMPGADLDAAASPSPAPAASSSAASAVAAPAAVSSAASTAGAPQVAAPAAPSAKASASSSSSQLKASSSDVAQPAAPSSVPWATPAASPMPAAGGSSGSALSASDSAPAMPAPSVSMGDEGADDIASVLGSVFGDGVKVTQVGGAE